MVRLPKRSYSVHPEPSKWRWLVRAGVLLLICIAAAILFVWLFAKPAAAPDTSGKVQDTQEDTPTAVSGTYMFSGTVVLARAVERAAQTPSGYDYSQPFSGMNTFEPAQYDEWIVDWECPTTDKITIPYAQQIANLQFNCRPEWLPEFTKYFSQVNLANNHSGDLGQETFVETQAHLRKAGLQVVGNYDPAETDDICEVMGLTVHVTQADGSDQEGVLPVAYCAWHYFGRDPRPDEIETMQRYAKVMPVFGLMHAGAEYVAEAGANQQAIARRIIDNGAEFVVGNSPHWVQNSEVYKDKPIFYSTGNFIFDQLEAETNRGVNIAVSLDIPYSDAVGKWLALAETCKPKAAADDCLEQAEQQGLEKLSLTLTYEPVANTSGAGQITRRGNEAIQRTVETRLRWAETKKALGQ